MFLVTIFPDESRHTNTDKFILKLSLDARGMLARGVYLGFGR